MLLAVAASFTGCLKDKGFDNNEYGINNPSGQPAGIAFPWAKAPTEPTLIGIQPSATTAQVIEAPTVTLDAESPAPQDITVNLVANPTLVTSFNTATGSSWLPMPVANYNIPSLKVTIPKGQKMAALKINVLNTNGLSFSDVYGFGFSIASVDQSGYTIASNLKNVVIGINVKNAYAADYLVNGYFFHPSAPRAIIDEHKEIGTVTDTRCSAGLGDLYSQNYYFQFDVSGSNITNWSAQGATPGGAQSGFMTADNPGGIAFVPMAPGTNGWLHSTYNNTYNATTKTFFMHYAYGVGGTSQNTWTRQVYEKWERQ